MIRRPPRSTLDRSSAASDVYKRQIDWCCPLQRIGTPWIGCSNFSSFKYGIVEVKNKQQVYCKNNNGYNRNHPVQITKFIERGPWRQIKITARYTCQTHIVHWPENQVGTAHGYPEMNITKGI